MQAFCPKAQRRILQIISYDFSGDSVREQTKFVDLPLIVVAECHFGPRHPSF